MKVYTDEGISGTNTKHRIGFNEMIADAMSGKIDLIVTKSVSRFARNTVDSLVTIRKLKEKRVEVFFEKENIYTFDGKGELLLTIMSSLAQEESRSISENVTWGQRKRFADGKVSLPYAPYREAMTQMVRTVLALPYEDVWIRSDDGLHLHGKYYAGRPGAPVQIMMHGYKSGAERDFCGGAQIAVQGGYHVLLVDQRAHGKSEGRCLTFGIQERYDCRAWVNYAVGRFGADTKILLYGVSMGAATVLMAGGLNLPRNVVGIVADCGYSSPAAIIRKVIRDQHLPIFPVYQLIRLGGKLFGGFDLESATVTDALAHCDIPVLLIHGGDDRFVPCDMGHENYAHCAARSKQLLVVPGAGHGLSYMVDREAYLAALESFLRSVLD